MTVPEFARILARLRSFTKHYSSLLNTDRLPSRGNLCSSPPLCLAIWTVLHWRLKKDFRYRGSQYTTPRRNHNVAMALDSITPGATPFTPGSAATCLYTDALFQLGDLKFKPHPALRQWVRIGASNLWPTCIFIRSGPRIGDLFKGLDPQAGRSVALPLQNKKNRIQNSVWSISFIFIAFQKLNSNKNVVGKILIFSLEYKFHFFSLENQVPNKKGVGKTMMLWMDYQFVNFLLQFLTHQFKITRRWVKSWFWFRMEYQTLCQPALHYHLLCHGWLLLMATSPCRIAFASMLPHCQRWAVHWKSFRHNLEGRRTWRWGL